jgi:UDPglucose 6-dehydrogenase
MKIAVAGLWHLGCVTAACLAKGGHAVIAYDPDANLVAKLEQGIPPVSEPGLTELLSANTIEKKLSYTHDATSLKNCEVLWICFDTPVNQDDVADVEFVCYEIKKCLSQLAANTLVIISSQIPAGTTQTLIDFAAGLYAEKNLVFAVSPENLRLGKALDIFLQPDRIVIGLDDLTAKPRLEQLLKPFSEKLVWMSVISAEMTKHAINSFLALSVTFANELGALCETVGANARDIEKAMKSEERIGPKAYVRAGAAIGGGTLLRDINYLAQLGAAKQRETYLISAVLTSNHDHKKWVQRKLTTLLENLRGKDIAVLGLTYKAGTDTLRRSATMETCKWLHQQGVTVRAYDPAINSLPPEYAGFLQLQTSVNAALEAADAVVIATEWPDFREISADTFIKYLKHPRVLDASGFIAASVGSDARIDYFSVGVVA